MTDFLNLILEPLQEVFLKFQDFLPNLLAMLVILLLGILLAKLLRFILVKFLHAIEFDNWSDRMGFTALMRKGDLWVKPSAVIGGVVFWILVIVTLMAGLGALNVAAIDTLSAPRPAISVTMTSIRSATSRPRTAVLPAGRPCASAR